MEEEQKKFEEAVRLQKEKRRLQLEYEAGLAVGGASSFLNEGRLAKIAREKRF